MYLGLYAVASLNFLRRTNSQYHNTSGLLVLTQPIYTQLDNNRLLPQPTGSRMSNKVHRTYTRLYVCVSIGLQTISATGTENRIVPTN